MNITGTLLLPVFGMFVILLAITGLYGILVSRNFIRVLIGLEILIKGVTLLLVVAGFVSGRLALAQALVITLIVIEVVVITVAAGLVLGVFRHRQSLDVTAVQQMKG